MKENTKAKSQMIHTRLTQDLFDALRKKADKHDITVSQMVRIVLQKAADPTTKINVNVCFERSEA